MSSAIVGVTIGNVFEWYEMYTFIYLAPIISKVFFPPNEGFENVISVFLIFAVGFIARPLGGVFFGRLGDLVGRKKTLVLSVVMMSIPSLLMAIAPTYERLGVYSTWILLIVRLLQSFPAGGEFPGAFCYLYVSAPYKNRRFLSSWGAVGNQIGIILALAEAIILENLLTKEALLSWGWRVAFFSGSLIGFLGFFLRYFLDETPLFRDVESHNRIVREPIFKVIKRHKKGVINGILYCVVDAVIFYLLSTAVPIYFKRAFDISYINNMYLTVGSLVCMTVLLPFFGKLGDLYSNKKLLISSTVGIVISSFFMLYAMNSHNLILTIIFIGLIKILLTCITALIPYLLCSLFPTGVRFTCVALSFNLVDGLIGGTSPLITLDLFKDTGSNGSFVWLVLISAIISLCAYFQIWEEDINRN